jgi:hypothetical protein
MATNTCPKCGTLNRPNARFCANCRQPLQGAPTLPATPPPPPRPIFTPGQPTFAASTQTTSPARRFNPVACSLVGVGCFVVLIVLGVLGYVLYQQFVVPPTTVAVTTSTPIQIPATSLTPPTPAPTVTAHAALATPTGISPSTTVPVGTVPVVTPPALPILSGTATPLLTRTPLTSLRVSRVAAANSGIRVNVRLADGSALQRAYVRVRTQKQDVSGNPVMADSVDDGYVDNSGSRVFNLRPGTYAVEVDVAGYPYGEQFNHTVTERMLTVLDITLGRMTLGVKDADGKPKTNQYVGVYLQKSDIGGNPIRGDEVASGYTDNTGAISFDLTAGYYCVEISGLHGYPWGAACDWRVVSGQTTSIIPTLGRVRVGIKDAEGKALAGKYVRIRFQKKDVNGNPTPGEEVVSGYTDNTGLVSFDVTAGVYAVEVSGLVGELWGDPLNHVVEAGKTHSILIALGRLTVGLKGADGKPITSRYAAVYLQKKDVAGNTIKSEQVANGYTDSAGLISWDLTAGNYVLEISSLGTQLNVPVQSGKTTINDGTRSTIR